MPNRYTDTEANYFHYPWKGGQVLVHKGLKKAFSGSNVGHEIETHQLNAFAQGLTPDEIQRLAISPEKNIRNITPKTEFEAVDKKIRGIYNKIRHWREILFSNEDYLSHIFEKFQKYSKVGEPFVELVTPVFEFIIENGLFDGLSATENARRMQIWRNAKSCIYVCESGLTRSKLIDEFNSVTQYEFMMMEWRVMLDEETTNEHFLLWRREHYPDVVSTLVNMLSALSDKERCWTCRFSDFRGWDRRIQQSIIYYFTRFYAEGEQDFYRHFVSAVISSAIRLELLVGGLFPARELFARKDTWSLEEEILFNNLVQNSDYLHQHICEQATIGMSECLLVSKSKKPIG